MSVFLEALNRLTEAMRRFAEPTNRITKWGTGREVHFPSVIHLETHANVGLGHSFCELRIGN